MQILNNAQASLTAMLFMTTIFFLVEVIVGYITNSMALIADSFHMFSDAIALVIAFISVRMSPKKWSKNTFGWARAEILGALVNAVFLCALCFSILIESIKRFMKPDTIHDPVLILITGGLGLFINLIGLVLFRDHHHHHGHSHGGSHHHHHHHHHLPMTQEDEYLVCDGDTKDHDKSSQKINYGLLCKHKSHTGSQEHFCNTADHSQTPSPDQHHHDEKKQLTTSKSPLNSDIKDSCNQSSSDNNNKLNNSQQNSPKFNSNNNNRKHSDTSNTDIHLAFRQTSKHDDYGSSSSNDHHNNHHHVHVNKHEDGDNDNDKKAKHHPTSSQMNMRGVFLHVMADALGSVIVMISAIIVLYTDWSIKPYIDPTLSVFMVCLILRSTWPLLTESAMILLQTVPTHIEVDSLRRRLTQEIQGVLAVHEFHVWQLAGDRIIASAHIRCHNLQDYMRIAEKVKEFFHNEGIHSTTIQPEFIDFENQSLDDSNDNCVLDCPSNQRPHCAPQTCCGTQKTLSEPLTDSPHLIVDARDDLNNTVLSRRNNLQLAGRSESVGVTGSKESSTTYTVGTKSKDDTFQVVSSATTV